MDKRIAIVGGGITGLSCAYELSKTGCDITLFEKETILGGRASRANQILTSNGHKDIIRLLKDLEIMDSVTTRINFDEMGAVIDGKLRSFKPFSLLLKPEKQLSLVEKYLLKPFFSKVMGIDTSQVEQLKDDLEQMEFSYEYPTNDYERLHKMSLKEWEELYPENVRDNVIYPVNLFLFVEDTSQISAAEGVPHVKDFIEAAGAEMYEMKGGVLQTTRVMKQKVDAEFNVMTEVRDVEETEEGVRISYSKVGEEETETFDYVVMANPTGFKHLLEGDFPDYSRVKAITVEGELKEDFKNVIGADKNTNLRALFATRKEHYIYPKDSDKEIDLSPVYKEYNVLGEEETPAYPLLKPGTDIPDLRYSERIFLAGDFYRYPKLNTSVYTGRKVAEMLKREICERNIISSADNQGPEEEE